MKKIYSLLLVCIPVFFIMEYGLSFFQNHKTDENYHITKLIEKLPEYIELYKKNDGYVLLDFPKNTNKNIVNANILTYNLTSAPAKIIYRIQYDRHLDKIVSIKKEP